MNRTLKYKEIIISYLEKNEYDNNLFDWIGDQPEIDQPLILREVKKVFEKRFEKKDGIDWFEASNIIDKRIDEFEESILDKKLHKSFFMMEMEERITDEYTFGYYLDFVRQEVITRIVFNPENQESWDLVHKAIQIEKDSGFFNPDNWSAIL